MNYKEELRKRVTTIYEYEDDEAMSEELELLQGEVLVGFTVSQLEQFLVAFLTKCCRKAPCFSNGDIRQLLSKN